MLYLLHAVDQRSHLQLQVPEGELHLLLVLHLHLVLLLHPSKLVSGRVVHHGGVAAMFLLLFQLKSIASFRQNIVFKYI